jgi:hypothetical protein
VLVGGRLVHEERAPAAPLRSASADEAAPA